MTVNAVKEAIIGNGTGVYFTWNGKQCGIEPEVHDSVFTFTMWCGEKYKDYSDFDELLLDELFDGKSFLELLDLVEIDFY